MNIWFIDEALKLEIEPVKKFYCSIFKRKKSRPIITFWVNSDNEEMVKYICILKGYIGTLDSKVFDNIQDFLMNGAKLKKEAKELGEKFDKKFRLLVSNK